MNVEGCMRAAAVAFAVAFIIFGAALVHASGSVDGATALSGGRSAGISESVFGSVGDRVWTPREGWRGSLRYAGTRLETPMTSYAGYASGAPGGPAPAAGASWSKKNTAIAIVASAVLPGLGELYCYRTSRDKWTLARVPVFMALEGVMWYGYFHNHSVGKDYKQDYMDYADEHWSLDRFLAQHPCCEDYGGCDDWQFYNVNCQGEFHYFFYTPLEVDEEEYYENIGKYNAFVYGWDDWANQTTYWTPHREYYWGLRKDSDTYLQRADNYLMGLIVSRVVSMIDAAWLSRRISKGESPDDGWSLRFKTYEEASSLMLSRRF